MEDKFCAERMGKQNGAILDRSMNYRYSLWRIWDENLPQVTFIMLNPSTADDKENDPTLRRCINFAVSWGFGSLEVVNLFALRSTNPNLLTSTINPVGKKNNKYILAAIERSEKVILAWGTKGVLYNRDKEVVKLLKKKGIPLYVLELTKDGHPRHPLYVKGSELPKILI